MQGFQRGENGELPAPMEDELVTRNVTQMLTTSSRRRLARQGNTQTHYPCGLHQSQAWRPTQPLTRR